MTTVTTGLTTGIFVNGQESAAASAGWLDGTDPSTGEPFGRTARGQELDVDLAVNAAARAQNDWGEAGPRVRGAVLLQLAALISRDKDDLAELESRDAGKTLHEARDAVQMAADYFEFYGQAVDKVYSAKIPGDGGFALTDRIPHGVTGHITPWNDPIMMLARTIAPSLAMGNACVLKPAEETSMTSGRVAHLAIEAGIPQGVFNVVPGLGEEAGAALAQHQQVDHLSFTGSREVGQLILQMSAQQLRPVTLELGGKSAGVVFGDIDVAAAVPDLLSALVWNSGQACNAQSRILVEDSLHHELLEALVEKVRRLEVGPALADKDLGPLISQKQLDRVSGYVGKGKEEARLVIGGDRPSDLDGGFFFAPTIFDAADPTVTVAREEIFGPVLVVSKFASEAEAIALANSLPYDLAAGVFTQDIDRAFRVSQRLRAGQVYVNNWGLGPGVTFPFGGLRHSGWGREKGLAALDEFSACRTTMFRVRP